MKKRIMKRMVFLFDMCSSRRKSRMRRMPVFVTAAIHFVAAVLAFERVDAQVEYSNWLLPGGSILRMGNQSPFIECNNIEDIGANPFTLSGDDGGIVLYGYKTHDGQTSLTDFVIKNSRHETLVAERCNYVYKLVYCKNEQSGYYVAATFLNGSKGFLCIYHFDKDCGLVNTCRYENGSYRSFLVMVPCDGFVRLLAYDGKTFSIESYKLAEDGVSLERQHRVDLKSFGSITSFISCIRQTLDGARIYACTSSDFFILDVDRYAGEITVSSVTKPDGNRFFALTQNDKYLMTVRNALLIGYDLSEGLDFSKFKVFYDFGGNNEGLFMIQHGVDGRLYATNGGGGVVYVIDGVEEGEVLVNTIGLDCSMDFSGYYFPQIMRRQMSYINPCLLPLPKIIRE